jgi:hypothetical protein
MPFFTVRRNCSAAIPRAPQQDVAGNTFTRASPFRLPLGNASSRAREQCHLGERACKL